MERTAQDKESGRRSREPRCSRVNVALVDRLPETCFKSGRLEMAMRRFSRFWLATQALFIFLALDLGILLFGFPDVYGFVRSRRSASNVSGFQGRRRLIVRAVVAVQTATRYYYRRRRDCLPRALTACLLLWRLGVPATLHIGVKRYPFGAHAWVECDGRRVLGDTREDWRHEPYVPIVWT